MESRRTEHILQHRMVFRGNITTEKAGEVIQGRQREGRREGPRRELRVLCKSGWTFQEAERPCRVWGCPWNSQSPVQTRTSWFALESYTLMHPLSERCQSKYGLTVKSMKKTLGAKLGRSSKAVWG